MQEVIASSFPDSGADDAVRDRSTLGADLSEVRLSSRVRDATERFDAVNAKGCCRMFAAWPCNRFRSVPRIAVRRVPSVDWQFFFFEAGGFPIAPRVMLYLLNKLAYRPRVIDLGHRECPGR